MKVSIITSVWNNNETIEDCINSVISQDYKNIEYIVVDGASTDGTIETINKYNDSIQKFVTEKDKGIYDGLNKGLKLATGDLIAFLHSDDLYASNTIISEIVNQFKESQSIDGVYGDLIYTDKHDTDKIFRYWKSREFEPKLLKKGWMPAHPTLILKKEIYDKYGFFDLKFNIAADYDFMLRVLTKDLKVKYISKVLYKMRVGGESNKTLKNILLKSKEDFTALKNNNVGGFFVLLQKNFSKLSQFIKKN